MNGVAEMRLAEVQALRAEVKRLGDRDELFAALENLRENLSPEAWDELSYPVQAQVNKALNQPKGVTI